MKNQSLLMLLFGSMACHSLTLPMATVAPVSKSAPPMAIHPIQTPAPAASIAAPPRLMGQATLHDARVTLLHPVTRKALVSGVQSDDSGRFSLLLPDDPPDLLLLTVERDALQLLTFLRTPGMTTQSLDAAVEINLASTVAGKLLGVKLSEVFASTPATEAGKDRFGTAFSQYQTLYERIDRILNHDILHVPLLQARENARQDATSERLETLADEIFMGSDLKAQVVDAVKGFNRRVVENVQEEGDPVVVGRWQRGDTSVAPPLISVQRDQLIIVAEGKISIRPTRALRGLDLFSTLNELFHNANTYTSPPTGGPVPAPVIPPPPPKIAFYTNRDGNNEVYVVDTDGGNPLNLTNNAADDRTPRWSPDRSKIGFHTFRDGNFEIYLMDTDGSNPVRLTNNAVIDAVLSWSPDGSKFAFHSSRDGNSEIYSMAADGSNPVRLTNDASSDSSPDWSPDGSKIIFSSNRTGNSEIYAMNADGTNQVNLTNNAGSDTFAKWSPDGSKIAFATDREGNWEIYVMNADGTNQINLTNAAGTDGALTWSPDGSQIAFHTNRDGNYEIYLMNADGSNQVNLTNDAGADSSPDWTP